MSRLTASPFHKPTPFVFPREPISPPETLLTDNGYPTVTVPPPTNTEHRDREEEQMTFNTNHINLPLHSRPGRPSISYQNSGFRESPSRPVHRSYRFLVVVVPPLRLINEHGQLGHTLASGPPHRLSQGIIMPLLPTMYGQLTAIAKEFNFPSTTGLCLYLQVNENGVVMTPRISDESWHMLWSHLFDMSTIPRGPPIGGRIEFDIDLQQARWYSSWLSTIVRDPVEHPISRGPSNAPSIVAPAENRDATDVDSLLGFDRLESSPLLAPRNAPNRHIPRKLSLVDRFDTPASRPESRGSATQGLGVPDQGVSSSKALSPIAQEEEPRSARDQLDDRVNSWRASAVPKPGPLAGRGQSSLEPANMPNNVSLDGDTHTSDIELDLEDFTWSISSAGPDDYDIASYGPPTEHLPSPDMAYRMFEDSPPTPSTATSWGAPLSFPPSPLSDYRPPSLDLAFRSRFSPPMTPATATSWGPASPATSFDPYENVFRAESIHLGDRGEFSRPVTPSTATTWGAALSYPPTPTTPLHVQAPDIAHRSFHLPHEYGFMNESSSHSQVPPERPWRSVWPYFKTSQPERTEPVQPWRSVWPYFNSSDMKSTRSESIRPWRSVWPYFKAGEAKPVKINSAQPWRSVWPYLKVHQDPPVDAKSTPETFRYPFISIYQPLYPYFDLYPAAAASLAKRIEGTKPMKVTFDRHYPSLEIYPPVYPHNFDTIYPEVPSTITFSSVFVSSSQYPMFDLYPASSNLASKNQASVDPPCRNCLYPLFNIYPAVYPTFDLYPAIQRVNSGKSAGLGSDDFFHQVPTYYLASSSEVARPATPGYGKYPNIVIYPPTYPHLNIYPPKAAEMSDNQTKAVAKLEPIPIALSVQYPHFDIYPVGYPNLNIYPVSSVTSNENESSLPPIIVSESQYPIFNLYPAVYPHFNIYPPKAGSHMMVSHQATNIPVQSDVYPFIRPYPPVYPHFDLYPSKPSKMTTAGIEELTVLLPGATEYPFLIIYPAVYPYFSLYPSFPGTTCEQLKEIHTTLVSHYPFLQIYPSIYPHLNIYPQIAAPTASLPQVIAHNQMGGKAHVTIIRKSHYELHQEVFHSGAVRTPGGNGMSIRTETDLRPLDVQPRHTQRRIVATRSPTGPAMYKPDTPPALPIASRSLPTPPLRTNGTSRSPSVMEQMAEYRKELSQARGYFPTAHSPSRTAVTATQRASMVSPLRHMPLPRSADSVTYNDEFLSAASEAKYSGLNRAKSVSSAGIRPSTIKARARDSLLLPRRHDL